MTESAPSSVLDHRAFRAAVAAQLTADRAAQWWPTAELERIEGAVRRRTQRSTASNLAAHLRALDDAADIDVDAPTASNRAAGRGVKVAISRATGWYVGHMASQLRHLGVATARAVRAMAVQIDDLEQRVAAIEDAAGSDEGAE